MGRTLTVAPAVAGAYFSLASRSLRKIAEDASLREAWFIGTIGALIITYIVLGFLIISLV